MNLLVLFIILNAVNVIIQTVKSLATIKCGKTIAAISNAIAYGLYTVVVVYMVCELPLWEKVVIVGACNFVGVFVVKLIEEKMRKDRLWKIEVTVPKDKGIKLIEESRAKDLSFNYVDIQKYWLFNFYCPTQKHSAEVKKLLTNYNVKYFVSESKNL